MNPEPSFAEIAAAVALAWATVLLCIAYLYSFASNRRRHE